jgi:Domain of unknown function (DUF5348)
VFIIAGTGQWGHYEAGHYELHGYPLRPGDVIEVLTDSGWIPGYIAYERGWYWVAPGGSMVKVGQGCRASLLASSRSWPVSLVSQLGGNKQLLGGGGSPSWAVPAVSDSLQACYSYASPGYQDERFYRKEER